MKPADCKTCGDHHQVCQDSKTAPCHIARDNHWHTWIPCPDCQPKDDRCGEVCEKCEKYICTHTSPIKNETEDDQHHLSFFCHGHPRQEGKECDECGGKGELHGCDEGVFGPNCAEWDCGYCSKCNKEKSDAHVQGIYDRLTVVPPTPKSGGMEWEKELMKQFGRCLEHNLVCSAHQGGYRDLVTFIRSELSRQAKELNERWEAREKRLREAVLNRFPKSAGHIGWAYDHAIEAFDQAAALKD